ncbi:MAG: TIGR03915 family putative DNA repair protein [Anaerovoracaceae bacterium]
MIDYLYDGSFEGLLTCIHEHYYREKAWGIYDKKDYQGSILNQPIEIATSKEKSMIVYNAIKNKISLTDLRRIYKVFSAEISPLEIAKASKNSVKLNAETLILEYVVLGFQYGYKVALLHGEPAVFAMQQIENKVNFETHRMKGLIRFNILAHDVMYGKIEPDHDIIEFLHFHFCQRFGKQAFVIHDTKREKALISQNGSWYISDFKVTDVPESTKDEIHYQNLWIEYFENIAIKERTNPRCQKNFMPTRYWKNLTEMSLDNKPLQKNQSYLHLDNKNRK